MRTGSGICRAADEVVSICTCRYKFRSHVNNDLYEISEKGDTRTMIPNAPANAAAAQIQTGTTASESRTDQAVSDIESAESIAATA